MKFKDSFIFMISLFVIGSMIGFAHENLLTLIKGNYVLRQGLIYGPFIPVYGIGLIVFYLVYSKINVSKYNKIVELLLVFIIGFFLGGITEYLCSYMQEKIFGTISWDYSYLKLNFQGRTSVLHASCWGMMSVLFYILIYPLLLKLKHALSNKNVRILLIIVSVLIMLDCVISIMACARMYERNNNIEAKNDIDRLLDEKYPDEYLNRIYNNAKKAKKVKTKK